jgi:hypothetical protein
VDNITNLNYAVSVTAGSIGDLPKYKTDWKINTVDLVSTGGASNTYAKELAYIKSLSLIPRLDIEMDIWAGGQIQTPIGNFTSYLQALKVAGWTTVCSEGGRSGDPTFIRSTGLRYVNYNCDQCGLWKDIYTDAGTVLNLWEAYYPSEVQYITQAAGSGKPNGILAGAWSNSGGDNQILGNSLDGLQPSYQSIIASLIALGHTVTDFEVWGGENSSRAENSALGFDTIVANLQKYYPPNGATPPPPVGSINFASTPNTTIMGGNMHIFVKGSDNALWHSNDAGKTWESLGGALTSAPTALTRGNVIDVFARGAPDGVFQKQWDGSKWRGWFNMGGQVLSGTAPEAVSPDGTAIDLYAIGSDKALWVKVWDGNTWIDWAPVAKAIK